MCVREEESLKRRKARERNENEERRERKGGRQTLPTPKKQNDCTAIKIIKEALDDFIYLFLYLCIHLFIFTYLFECL